MRRCSYVDYTTEEPFLQQKSEAVISPFISLCHVIFKKTFVLLFFPAAIRLLFSKNIV